jgi:hypothetical protein
MQEHVDLMRSLLVRDVAYQAPIIAAYDREDFRVAAYLAKSIAHMTLKPQTVKVRWRQQTLLSMQFMGSA